MESRRSPRSIAGLQAAGLAAGLVIGAIGGAVLTPDASSTRTAQSLTCTPNEITICLAASDALPGWAYVGSPAPSVSESLPPSTSPSLSPPPSASPAPTPVVTPTPVPSLPTPTPSPTPIQIACGSSLQTVINNAAAGSTIDLGPTCVYNSGADVTKKLTVLRGLYQQGGTALRIKASGVIIDGGSFKGGSRTIDIQGVDDVKILNSSFVEMQETSIYLTGPSVDRALIENNRIIQTIPHGGGYSPIAGQGFGAGKNTDVVIRNNFINQGYATGVYHFGVEVWDNTGLIIEGNTHLGVSAMVSIPRSDGAIVRNNTFGCAGCGTNNWYWGIEVSDVDNADIYGNHVWGAGANQGPDGRGWIQLQLPTINVKVHNNDIHDVFDVINPAGSGHVITDNCLYNVTKLFAQGGGYAFNGPITNLRNGPCP